MQALSITQYLEQFLERLEIQSVSQQLTLDSQKLHQHNNDVRNRLFSKPCIIKMNETSQKKRHQHRQQRQQRQHRQHRQHRQQRQQRQHHQQSQQEIHAKQQKILVALGKIISHQKRAKERNVAMSPRGISIAYKKLLKDTKKKIIQEYVLDGEYFRKHGRHMQALKAFETAILTKEQPTSIPEVKLRNKNKIDNVIEYRDLNDSDRMFACSPWIPDVSATKWKLSPFNSPPHSPPTDTASSPILSPTLSPKFKPSPPPPSKNKGTRKKYRQRKKTAKTNKLNEETLWSNPIVHQPHELKYQKQVNTNHHLGFFHCLPPYTNYRKPKTSTLRYPIKSQRARFEEEDSLMLKKHKDGQRKWERTGILYSRDRNSTFLDGSNLLMTGDE
jgi:hypothetical protein